MAWGDDYALGVADMDATHREFIEQLDALLGMDDAQFPAAFHALCAHTRLHFQHEGGLMRACRFPAIGEHEREHLRVLGELAHVGRAVNSGRLVLARQYARALPQWFDVHLRTMDAALAARLRQVGRTG